ncbi:MAG: transposase [Robiginitomaculum sp.]
MLWATRLGTKDWHKEQDIKASIENTGAKLLMLPPYSPDLNPIEHTWANLKSAIKANAHSQKNIKDNIQTQLEKINQSNVN